MMTLVGAAEPEEPYRFAEFPSPPFLYVPTVPPTRSDALLAAAQVYLRTDRSVTIPLTSISVASGGYTTFTVDLYPRGQAQ